MGIVKSLKPNAVWEYTTRTLTNLSDSRASKIDNLDKSISSLNDLSTADIDSVIQNRFKSYYIYDDFGDNKLVDRTLDTLVLKDGIFQNPRPEWTVKGGSPSVSDGKLILPDSSSTIQKIETSSTFIVGVWELVFNYDTAPTQGGLSVFPMYQDSENYYRFKNNNEHDAIELFKMEDFSGSTLISTPPAVADTNIHTLKCSRDSSGNWELFLDGSSLGTAQASWIPSTFNIRIESSMSPKIYIHSFKVY